MAHDIVSTSHSNLSHLRIHGSVTLEDINCADEIGLTAGRPVWLLVDLASISPSLPDGFLEMVRTGIFTHPNLQHLALVARSSLLRSTALIVATLANHRDRLTLYDAVPTAELHLMSLIRQHGL